METSKTDAERTRITITLREELVEELREEAKRENLSLSRYIERLLLKRARPIE